MLFVSGWLVPLLRNRHGRGHLFDRTGRVVLSRGGKQAVPRRCHNHNNTNSNHIVDVVCGYLIEASCLAHCGFLQDQDKAPKNSNNGPLWIWQGASHPQATVLFMPLFGFNDINQLFLKFQPWLRDQNPADASLLDLYPGHVTASDGAGSANRRPRPRRLEERLSSLSLASLACQSAWSWTLTALHFKLLLVPQQTVPASGAGVAGAKVEVLVKVWLLQPHVQTSLPVHGHVICCSWKFPPWDLSEIYADDCSCAASSEVSSASPNPPLKLKCKLYS